MEVKLTMLKDNIGWLEVNNLICSIAAVLNPTDADFFYSFLDKVRQNGTPKEVVEKTFYYLKNA
jgi:hypothetical protein